MYEPSDPIDVDSLSSHADLPREAPPDRTQLAGDVVALPINPFQGSDRSNDKNDASRYSVGDKRGSDPKIKSIGTNTSLDWLARTKQRLESK